MRKNVLYLSVLIVMLLNFGCASSGKQFNFAKRSELVIGKTSKSEAENLLGEPIKSSIINNDDGNFQLLNYVYAYATLSGAAARALTLEFIDGVLNGKIYNSGFQEDSTAFRIDTLSQVVRGATRKSEITSLLGEPSGVVHCPTSFTDIKEKCKNATEVWLWNYTKKSEGLDVGTIKSKTVKIIFDKNNIVSDIESVVEN
jgi:outer membrane protein assembly factor BamE (lipoprotein component of BamABCDE complex)